MAYQDLLPSQQYIPVVQEYTSGSPLGAIKAVAGLNTNQGAVQGFDANGNIICTTTDGGSGVFYGIQLEVTKADAEVKNWPNNSSDVVFGGHAQSAFVYSV